MGMFKPTATPYASQALAQGMGLGLAQKTPTERSAPSQVPMMNYGLSVEQFSYKQQEDARTNERQQQEDAEAARDSFFKNEVYTATRDQLPQVFRSMAIINQRFPGRIEEDEVRTALDWWDNSDGWEPNMRSGYGPGADPLADWTRKNPDAIIKAYGAVEDIMAGLTPDIVADPAMIKAYLDPWMKSLADAEFPPEVMKDMDDRVTGYVTTMQTHAKNAVDLATGPMKEQQASQKAALDRFEEMILPNLIAQSQGSTGAMFGGPRTGDLNPAYAAYWRAYRQMASDYLKESPTANADEIFRSVSKDVANDQNLWPTDPDTKKAFNPLEVIDYRPKVVTADDGTMWTVGAGTNTGTAPPSYMTDWRQ